MTPPGYELLLSLPTVRVGAARTIQVTHFLGAPDNNVLSRVRDVSVALHKKLGLPIASLVILDASIHREADRTISRDFFQKSMKDVGTFIRATGVVIDGTGFAAAAVRSVMAGVSLVARLGYPLKCFSDGEEAARWLAPYVTPAGESVDRLAADAVDCVRALRAPG